MQDSHQCLEAGVPLHLILSIPTVQGHEEVQLSLMVSIPITQGDEILRRLL